MSESHPFFHKEAKCTLMHLRSHVVHTTRFEGFLKIHDVRFTSNSEYVIGLADRYLHQEIWVWHVESGCVVARRLLWTGNLRATSSLQVTDDNKYAIVHTNDTIIVLQLSSMIIAKTIRTLHGHPAESVHVTPHGNWIVYLEHKSVNIIPLHYDPVILDLPNPCDLVVSEEPHVAKFVFIDNKAKMCVAIDKRSSKMWVFHSHIKQPSASKQARTLKGGLLDHHPNVITFYGFRGPVAFSRDGSMAAYVTMSHHIKIIQFAPILKTWSFSLNISAIHHIQFGWRGCTLWLTTANALYCYNFHGQLQHCIADDFSRLNQIFCSRKDDFLIVRVNETVTVYTIADHECCVHMHLYDRCAIALSDDGLELLSVVHGTNRVSRLIIASRATDELILFSTKPQTIHHLGRIGKTVYCLSADAFAHVFLHMWRLEHKNSDVSPVEERYPLPPDVQALHSPNGQLPSLVSGSTIFDLSAFLLSDMFPNWYVQLCGPKLFEDIEAAKLLQHRPRSIYLVMRDEFWKGESYLSMALRQAHNKYRAERMAMIRVILALPVTSLPSLKGCPSLLHAALDLEDLRLIKEVLEKYSQGRLEHNLRVKVPSHAPTWRYNVLDIDPSEEMARCLCDLLDRYPDLGVNFLQTYGLMLMENVNEREFHLRARIKTDELIVSGCDHVSVNDGIMSKLKKSAKEISTKLGVREDDEYPLRLPELEHKGDPIQSIDAQFVGIYKAGGILSNGDTLLSALLRTNDVKAFDNDVARSLVHFHWRAYARKSFFNEFGLYLLELLFLVVISLIDDEHNFSSFPSIYHENKIASVICFFLIPLVLWSLWREYLQLIRSPKLHFLSCMGKTTPDFSWRRAVRKYSSDPWNLLDLAQTGLLLSYIITYMSGSVDSQWLLSISVYFKWISMFYYLQVSKEFI